MIVKLQVPNKAQMGYGIGKCIQYGVEYEVLNDLQVELTCNSTLVLMSVVDATIYPTTKKERLNKWQ